MREGAGIGDADLSVGDLYTSLSKTSSEALRKGSENIDKLDPKDKELLDLQKTDDYKLGKHVKKIKVALLWVSAAMLGLVILFFIVWFVVLSCSYIWNDIMPDAGKKADLLNKMINSVLLVAATLFVQNTWKKIS